jgi:CRP-like cAMP-binding protein
MNEVSRDADRSLVGPSDLLEPYRPLHVRYAAEELICREGAFAAGLQWIARGLVLETDRSAQGDSLESPPDLLLPGDILGVEILIPGAEERHRTTCRALTEVSLVFLDRASLDRALERDQKFARVLIGHLAARHDRSRRARARLGLGPTSRLAATLLGLQPLCEATRVEAELALPEAIDLRVLGDLAGLSPAQMRRFSPQVAELREVSGRVVFRPVALLAVAEASESRSPRASLR